VAAGVAPLVETAAPSLLRALPRRFLLRRAFRYANCRPHVSLVLLSFSCGPFARASGGPCQPLPWLGPSFLSTGADSKIPLPFAGGCSVGVVLLVDVLDPPSLSKGRTPGCRLRSSFNRALERASIRALLARRNS
jgi:hypothetical protein